MCDLTPSWCLYIEMIYESTECFPEYIRDDTTATRELHSKQIKKSLQMFTQGFDIPSSNGIFNKKILHCCPFYVFWQGLTLKLLSANSISIFTPSGDISHTAHSPHFLENNVFEFHQHSYLWLLNTWTVSLTCEIVYWKPICVRVVLYA